MRMSKIELLNEYKEYLINLKKCAKDDNINERELDNCLLSCFQILRDKNSSNQNLNDNLKTKSKCCMTVLKTLSFALMFCIIAYIMLQNHQTTSSIVLRNVQGLIYPGLKFLRFISVPIIKRFPSLTELYDETCLIANPYFYVSDMECWPCSNIHSVIDLSGFNNHSLYQSGTPYIVKTSQKLVNLNDVQQLYENNTSVFDKDSYRLFSNHNDIKMIKDLNVITAKVSEAQDVHILWRINRMTPARLLRSLFPRPYIVSKWSGQSVERFLTIDEPKASPYALPNPECSYVFIIQASGERTIILKPSRECSRDCRTVSVVLKSSYVLWYNWWYWRPLSLPVENSTDVAISYISSYC